MVVLVRIPVQLDEANAGPVRAGLLAEADRHPQVLIADMSGTRSCDWAGAAALASTFSQAMAGGTELRLVLTDESVRRVISVNGLDQVMPIFEDVTSASVPPPVG
jgi:anti-anti-sigma factor